MRRLRWWLACFLDWPREVWEAVYRPHDRCVGCGALPPKDAHAQGWRFDTGHDGHPRQRCVDCQRMDTDGVQW